jgi:hypothetical protein
MTQPRLPDTRDLELRLPDMRGFEPRFPDRRDFDPRFPDMWDLEPRLPGPPNREGSPTGREGRGAVHSPGVGGMGRDEP